MDTYCDCDNLWHRFSNDVFPCFSHCDQLWISDFTSCGLSGLIGQRKAQPKSQESQEDPRGACGSWLQFYHPDEHPLPNFDVKPEDSIAMLYHVIIWVEHWAEVHFGMFNPCWADTFISVESLGAGFCPPNKKWHLPFFTAQTFQVEGQRSVNMLDHSMNMIPFHPLSKVKDPYGPGENTICFSIKGMSIPPVLGLIGLTIGRRHSYWWWDADAPDKMFWPLHM